MDLIPTDSTVVDPVSTAPESSSSPNQTIPRTLPDVKSTADLEQARSVIGEYAKRGGHDIQWYSDESRPDKADTNGFYENGAIYINENAENPYMEVFKHELFHSLADSDKQAVTEFFRRNVNENTQAFQDYKTRTMQANRRKNLRYSEADFWEEYTAQNAEFLLDEAWIERLAQTDRTLAQRILDWIRRAVQRIGDLFSAPKDYSAEVASHESGRVLGMSDTQLRQAQRLYERALNGAKTGIDTKYSIKYNGGEPIVVIEDDIFAGHEGEKPHKVIRDYIKSHYSGDFARIIESGQKVYFGKDLPGKYTQSKSAFKNPVEIKKAKGQAAQNLNELIEIGTDRRWNKNAKEKHAEDAKYGWYKYATRFQTNGKIYTADVLVRNDANGKKYLYDVQNIKNEADSHRGTIQTDAPQQQNLAVPENGFNTTIPQSGTGVNNSIRESAQNDTTKSSLKRSKFYDSIQQTDTVAEEVKQRAQESEADYYYRQIGNEETMKKAVAQVEQNVDAAGRRFSAMKGNATTDEIAQGFVLLKKYQDMGDYDAAADTAHKLSEIATKTGQQLQIYSILGRMTPEGMLRYAAKELETMKQRLAENPNRWGTWLKNNADKLRLTAEDAEKITAYMERAQAMPDGRDKVIMFAEIQKLLQAKMPSTLGSKLSTLQRISLLLNPKTVITRNALSNMLINPVYAVRDFAASGMDKALSKKTGVRTLAAPNYKDQAKGWKKGVFESYDDFRRAINTRDVQANRYEISNKLGSGPAFKGKNPLSKAIAFLDRTTGFLLDVGDRPFFEGYFLESLNGQLRTNKTDTPTPDMIDIATQTALEKTWQDDNVITRSASKMKNALNFGQDFGLGSMIVPFVKTPSNIAKAIVDFSPAGFAKAITVDAYNFTKAVKNGTVTAQMQNKFAKNIGNGIAGVLMYAAGLALAANGVTTGSDDEPDKDIRNFKRNILGVSPYSIKIGNETFTYDWAQPVGSALSITADIYKNNINMDNAVNIITNALATGGNTLFEQSMLSGLSELFGGYDGFMPAVANAVLDLPSQFVPTLSKQAAELTDPYARRTATGSMTDKAVNKVLARIPGASKTLEPVVDVLGRDVKRYGGKNNLFNVFLNPANVNIANPTAETKEIWRLYEETGDVGVFPKVAPNTFTYGGTSYSLTAKEQTQFQRVMGQETAKALQELFAGNSYDNPKSSKLYRKSTAKNKNDKTDEQVRTDLVKEIIDEAYEAAKVDMLKRRGVVLKNKK